MRFGRIIFVVTGLLVSAAAFSDPRTTNDGVYSKAQAKQIEDLKKEIEDLKEKDARVNEVSRSWLRKIGDQAKEIEDLKKETTEYEAVENYLMNQLSFGGVDYDERAAGAARHSDASRID